MRFVSINERTNNAFKELLGGVDCIELNSRNEARDIYNSICDGYSTDDQRFATLKDAIDSCQNELMR